MVIHMKTTLNIDDTLMRRLRQEAARRDTTMTALVEAGLRIVLADPDAAAGETGDLPPLPSWSSGGQLVDISDREGALPRDGGGVSAVFRHQRAPLRDGRGLRIPEFRPQAI